MIDPEEERARFISLREVLFLIAKARNCDAQKAAEWLALNLKKDGDWRNLICKWYSKTDGISDLETYDEHEQIEFLIHRLANHGVAKTPIPNKKKTATDWSDFDDIPF